MICRRFCLPAVAALAATGCATFDKPSTQAAEAQRCYEAVGQGTAFGKGHARAIAENDISQQASDARGYLVSSGIRRVRPAGQSLTCKPFALVGGMTQCTVVARYCGR